MAVTRTDALRMIAEEVASIKPGEIDADEITADHHLWADAGEPSLELDSLEIFELVYRVESRTGLQFEGLDLMAATTVGELVERVTGG